jgi:hypothetical protein
MESRQGIFGELEARMNGSRAEDEEFGWSTSEDPRVGEEEETTNMDDSDSLIPDTEGEVQEHTALRTT